jgi:hypothetical protein
MQHYDISGYYEPGKYPGLRALLWHFNGYYDVSYYDISSYYDAWQISRTQGIALALQRLLRCQLLRYIRLLRCLANIPALGHCFGTSKVTMIVRIYRIYSISHGYRNNTRVLYLCWEQKQPLTCSELRIHSLVANHDHSASVTQRVPHVPSDQVPVPQILGMHRQCHVSEHRLRSCRRYGHTLA